MNAKTVDVNALLARYKNHEATIAVIGLGYVGLPLIRAMTNSGFTALGVDVDTKKVDMINKGQSYIHHIPSSMIAEMVNSGKFAATTDFARLKEADAILICVPTPLTLQREPDMTFVVKSCEGIAPHLQPGQLVILESTTYPGTTRDVMRPILERGGLISGKDFFLAYSPEREDPGNPDFTTDRIPKVVGGHGEDALKLACAMYDQFVTRTVPVSSPEAAEAVKLTENIHRAVNIALVNELKLVYAAMGIDVWEVIDAAKTKPFGFTAFYPGPGLGGHCIPIDPFYLTWKAREYEVATRFIELAGEVNTSMPRYVIDRLEEELNTRSAKAMNGAKILMLGLSYKKNVDDTRESPSFKLLELMHKRGAKVDYHDPFVPEIGHWREAEHFAGMKSMALTPEKIKAYDAVLISTDHDDVDYKSVVDNARLVVDSRNACARKGFVADNVVKA